MNIQVNPIRLTKKEFNLTLQFIMDNIIMKINRTESVIWSMKTEKYGIIKHKCFTKSDASGKVNFMKASGPNMDGFDLCYMKVDIGMAG